jgi:hypothetical protein
MATVTASFKLPDTSPYVGTVVFRPLSTPLVSSPDLVISSGDVTVYTDDSGALTVDLIAGNYRVLAGSSRAVLIAVPTGSSTVSLESIITTVLETDFETAANEQHLIEWAAAGAYQLSSATYDDDGLISSGTVVWPDGSAGVYSVTSKNATWTAVDAYTVTHTNTGQTVTQAAVTRDDLGNVVSQPALTVS